MTVAGIEIRRDDTGIVPAGTLVLTTNKRNPSLITKGTTATASSGATYYTSSGPGSFLQLVITCPHDSIPCLGAGHSFVAYNSSWNAGTGQWTWQYVSDAAPGTNINWFVFAEQALTPGTVGIELYADDGTLQFALHPDNKPLRVVDVLHSIAGPVTYPSGPTYAAAIGKHSGRLIWESPAKPSTFSLPDPDYYIELWHGIFGGVISDVFDVYDDRLDPPSDTFVGTNTPDFSLERDWTELDHMILDVTGY